MEFRFSPSIGLCAFLCYFCVIFGLPRAEKLLPRGKKWPETPVFRAFFGFSEGAAAIEGAVRPKNAVTIFRYEVVLDVRTKKRRAPPCCGLARQGNLPREIPFRHRNSMVGIGPRPALVRRQRDPARTPTARLRPPAAPRSFFAAAALLVAVTLLAYSNSLRVPFVFDDLPAILDNPTLGHFSTALFPATDSGSRSAGGR